MAGAKLCIAMGDSAVDIDGRGPLQMGGWSLGIFWYVFKELQQMPA